MSCFKINSLPTTVFILIEWAYWEDCYTLMDMMAVLNMDIVVRCPTVYKAFEETGEQLFYLCSSDKL